MSTASMDMSSAAPVGEHPSVDKSSKVFEAAGMGVFAGTLAAALSHLVWGGNLLILAFVYGFSMASLRGWPELAGILTMIGTNALYFAIYDVIALDSASLGLTLGLIGLALTLFVGYVVTVGNRVSRASMRALNESESMAVDVARSQHWEERYFAALRAKRAAGEPATWLFVRPLALGAAGLVVGVWLIVGAWPDSRMVGSVAWGVVFLQSIVFGRMVQYYTRLYEPPAEMVVARAARRPILFLRPFSLDALPVSPIGYEWYSFINVLSWLDKRTFEEHLSNTFEDLGPVIALGRPGEEVALLGAAREYADDASWRDLVLKRASASQFVIMEVDATPGMEWELDQVSRLVGLQRVLIVLPPGEDLFEKRPSEWYARWATLRRRMEFLPEVSEDTAAVLYDGDDQPLLVAGKESSVPRTLAAIKTAWLEERQTSPIETDWVERAPAIAAVGASAGGSRSRQAQRSLAARRGYLTGLARRHALLHGKDDPEALRLKQELALVLVAEGDLAKARKLQEEVVAGHHRRGGADDSVSLAAQRELAVTLRLLGDLTRARATLAHVEETSVRVYGDDRPETLRARTQLALVMRDQGDLDAARRLLERTLENADSTSDRGDIGRAERLLASVLTISGELEPARALLVPLLEESRERDGDEHPETLEAISLLAETLDGLGEREEAARLAREGLAGYERLMGAEHPMTLKLLVNAARLTANANKLTEARALGERAVTVTRRRLGAEHPDALTALSVLGWARRAQGELEPAHELFALAWSGRRKVLGESHTQTLAALTNLATVQLALARDEEAVSNLERAVEGYERTLGSEHPHTLTAMSNLATARAQTDDLAGARELHEFVVSQAQRHLGGRHPDTASMTVALARTVAEQGDTRWARRLLEEAIDTLASALGEDHPATASARSDLRALEHAR